MNSVTAGVGEYEPKILPLTTPKEIGRHAASVIAALLQQKSDAVLGMATGDTPLPMYEQLVSLRKDGLDFSRATFFNLDEYIGLPSTHPQSYRAYMREKLFAHINARPENIFIPNGMTADIKRECVAYERALKTRGGIDLQILGVGANGHIGFCEPGTPLDSRTHRAELAERTRKDNARFFARIEDVPTHAISIGLATILDARQIILLASGAAKANAISAILTAPVSSDIPATILRRHPNVELVVDKDAFPLMARASHGVRPEFRI